MTLRLAAFTVIGALAGYGYHRIIGCRSGACPITANPVMSTVWGALAGFFASGGWAG